MAGLSPTAAGAEMEALVIARIYAAGGRASIPFDHGMGYDLVSDFDGKLNRIEVKRANCTHSRSSNIEHNRTLRYECDLRARNMVSKIRLPSPDTSDFFAIEAGGFCYVIPTRLLEGRQGIVMRPPGFEALKEGGPIPVVNTSDYLEAWGLLR